MSRYFANVTLFDGRTVRRSRECSSPAGRSVGRGARSCAARCARGARGPRHRPELEPGLIDCHVHLIFDGQADFKGSKGAHARPRGDQSRAERGTASASGRDDGEGPRRSGQRQSATSAWRSTRAYQGPRVLAAVAAATYAPLPMRIGATRMLSLPTKTPSSIIVLCLLTPS